MNKPKIVCVVPTIRPERMAEFEQAWKQVFDKHDVQLITVMDGDNPEASFWNKSSGASLTWDMCERSDERKGLICRRTDAVRNLGFILAATQRPDYVLTLDDDVYPVYDECDPVEDHLEVLQMKVPTNWMNTATGDIYLRGFPYAIREEAQVMVSHGVWIKTPDFDGRTQLELSNGGTQPLPYVLPYFRGPVPKGCLFPVCGMNLMVRKEMLPYLYFAPMGADSGFPDLHRFADIWMGVTLKRLLDYMGFAMYTGASTVLHTRASDPHKNVELEKLGIEWNEKFWKIHGNTPTYMVEEPLLTYVQAYLTKAARFRDHIIHLQG